MNRRGKSLKRNKITKFKKLMVATLLLFFTFSFLFFDIHEASAGTLINPETSDFQNFQAGTNSASGTVAGQPLTYSFWQVNGGKRWYKTGDISFGTEGIKYFSTLGIPSSLPTGNQTINGDVTLFKTDDGTVVWNKTQSVAYSPSGSGVVTPPTPSGPTTFVNVRIMGGLVTIEDEDTVEASHQTWFEYLDARLAGGDEGVVILEDESGSTREELKTQWVLSTVTINGQEYNMIRLQNNSVDLKPNTKYKMTYFVDKSVANSAVGTGHSSGGSGFFANAFSDWVVRAGIEFSINDSGITTIHTSGLAQESPVSGQNINSGEDFYIPMMIEKVGVFEKAMRSAIIWISSALATGIKAAGNMIDWALRQTSDFGENDGLETVWKTTRNVSLSLLTLGLLIIAFANILSINLDNYGLARMLPKLIIGIILVFLSYFIPLALMNFTNALQALLKGSLDSAVASVSATGVAGDSISIANMFSDNPGLNLLNAGNAIFQVFFIVLLMVFIFLVALWLVLILIVRRAILMLLIAVAPIAFICNILPFTEKYYTEWWSRFWKWLLIGPMIMLLYGLSGIFLAAGFVGARFGESDLANTDSWIWLIATAVLIFLAASVPLKMGNEVYGQISKVGGKAAGATGLKARYNAFNESRKQYGKLKAQDDANKFRAGLAKRGKIGQIAAGTRGVFSKDDEVAKRVNAEIFKNYSKEKKEEALAEMGGANADFSDPRVLALLEDIASSVDVRHQNSATKEALATAVALGSGDNPAVASLQGVSQKLSQNSDKEASMTLYSHATDPANNYFNNIVGRSAAAADELEKNAVKVAAKKTFFERGKSEISVLKTAETRASATGGAQLAQQTRLVDRESIRDRDTNAARNQKSGPKTISEQDDELVNGNYYA
jgi:hypothetical protein